jgi:hypothetical protein
VEKLYIKIVAQTSKSRPKRTGLESPYFGQSGNVKNPARAWEREECDRIKARVLNKFAIGRGINTI